MATENYKPNCKQLVDILWTGGWDSTYRVLCLSRMNVILQPHYIIYDGRRSTKQELGAIRDITEDILRDPRTKCELKPLILTNEKNIPPDEEISSAFEIIRQHVLIGIQYEYLARYAKDIENIEIGIETGGQTDLMINTMGKMNYVDNDGLSYWEIDKHNSQKALLDVFGHFRWPLYQMGKVDMKEDSERQGFAHIMDKTWFCHFPAKNRPCGSCFPCRFTIQGGMGSRLPHRAIKRYNTDQKYKENRIYQVYKRFRRKVLNY
ncbi:MAG TPA: hypothetical protein DEA85_04165 [Firmicutes bacterium]|nr:hypothetical protein [Bacillota bacterium]HBS93189.1 hypothetical protein [Bacillota bacterium]